LGLLFLRLESIWLAHVGADELKAVGVALIVVGLLFLIPNLKILFDHRLELVAQKDFKLLHVLDQMQESVERLDEAEV